MSVEEAAKEDSGSQSDVNKVLGDQSFVSSVLSSVRDIFAFYLISFLSAS
jgi:hypothetical protein